MANFQVAIDGPAGSGKSTISKIIADKLKMTHIDTGAMYRAVTLLAIQKKIDLTNESEYRFLESTKISYEHDKILLNNQDVTDEIRNQEVTENVSLVASFPYVRKILVIKQKEAALNGNIIMDGRDIGTVVMPKANLKIFLTAQITERAKRRQMEKQNKGEVPKLEDLVSEIETRDKKDSTRIDSPLKMADDAILIDTTNLSINEVVEKIIRLIKLAKGEINE
ncbi:MAG: (d)CMP kinase [Acholeplasmataceae bacterium]